MVSIPKAIVEAYALDPDLQEEAVAHIPSLINSTFRVESRLRGHSGPIILQRLHPVFGANVHLDIEVVTAHLETQGVETPRLIRNRNAELWTVETSTEEPRIWRAQTFIDGLTIHRSSDPSTLASAAALLGSFHAALFDLRYEFVHVRPIHDTAKHLAKLLAALASERARGDAQVQALGARVARHAETVRLDFSEFPRRIVHGDPKLSNLLFHRDQPNEARCLIDLDALGYDYLAYELGDALRSWCNSAGEDTPAVNVQPDLLAAVLSGYARERPPGMAREEIFSALDGLETVSLELASRFAADAIIDSYFGWDATRFPSRRAHNLVRAEGQLALSEHVRDQRAALEKVALEALP
ncbi:MAG TPA: phosphotransferase, partial [Polyangiaceae bacterium]|nr:phosphotransferase [Polyangiaceae bacterium]